MPGQEGDLGRLQPEAGDVEQAEVLQRIGADDGLGALDLTVRAGRNQLRADLGGEDLVEHAGGLRRDQVAHGDPADQVLDQGLGHRAVDIVVAHLVADAVGAPAQTQLRQVPGPQDEGVVAPGEAEQIVRAQTGPAHSRR